MSDQLVGMLDVTDPQIKAIEEEARAARLGLWRDEKPVPPWEWRKSTRI